MQSQTQLVKDLAADLPKVTPRLSPHAHSASSHTHRKPREKERRSVAVTRLRKKVHICVSI